MRTQLLKSLYGGGSVDKKVPLSFIFAVIVQTGVLFWWGGNIDTKLVDHERRIVVNETRDHESMQSNIELCQRLARVETKVGMSLELIQKIDTSVSELKRGR